MALLPCATLYNPCDGVGGPLANVVSKNDSFLESLLVFYL